MNESEILIQNRFKELPSDLQKALTAFDWKGEIKKIADLKKLDEEHRQSLETETLLLLYSFEPKENFYENLISKVGLEEKTAEEIFDLIQEKIVLVLANKLPDVSAVEQPSLEKTPDTKPEDSKPQLTNTPNYSSYESGKDPYREPLN